MAIALVQKSAAVVEGTTSPQSVTLPAGSTAGNLIVGCVTASWTAGATSTGFSFPVGWTQAINFASATGETVSAIWYYANNPGAISSVSVSTTGTGTLSFVAGVLLEVSGAATTTPLDRTGSSTGGGSTTRVVSTSATTTAANELAVTSFNMWVTGGSSKSTITPGAGWTNIQNDGGLKQSFHFAADYQLDTGASGQTITETETSSITLTTSLAAVIATFKQGAAAAQIWQPPAIRKLQAVQRASTW